LDRATPRNEGRTVVSWVWYAFGAHALPRTRGVKRRKWLTDDKLDVRYAIGVDAGNIIVPRTIA